ncbi:ABC transporter ATP-binding protein [Sphingomonas sp. LaA6.9]|uniref:ABC transporter ATP-binding protein n=1 Tax=Sphingomonas sp. LaA6.9 TaxID=2919914 RepID=UPI001F4FB355|nr:ATP-binding cassette domain-containing protein [Sphingomonas sp. LaA6.9]MCJ8157130.1 ATP-binding cassette domain-containing protein [Sphingomonas sp. LaA6.9]
MPPPVRVSGLRSAFGTHVVHDNLDLEMRQGEILGIVGGSGTGKSVLLNTILGLKQPDGGQVEIFGRDVHDPAANADVERRTGVMFQGGALFSALTVGQNVEAPIHEHTSLSGDFVRQLAQLKIRLSGLDARVGDQMPSELSGGMRKRVGIARALALDPELLFLDEPTAGLDPIGAAEFDQLTRSLCDSLGLSVFIITHDLDTLYAITDRVAVLADKRVVATAPVAELERSDHPWIRAYFNGPRGRAAQGAWREKERTR